MQLSRKLVMECQKYGYMAFDYINNMNNELKIINGNEYYIEHINTIFDDYDWMEYIFNIEISKKQSYERVFVNICLMVLQIALCSLFCLKEAM